MHILTEEELGLSVRDRYLNMHFLTEEDLRTFCKGQVTKLALSHRGGLQDLLQVKGS